MPDAKDFKVDFFIAGFPKCGTTSLAAYLSEHPNVAFSSIKEPFFFCTDFPQRRVITSWEAYEKQFSPSPETKLFGEGTVCYVYSEAALNGIRDHNPNAKLIFLTRNPVDLIQSSHANKLRVLDEDVESLEAAWQLQEKRKNGECIPRLCAEPFFLQYKEMGLQGKYLKRVLEMFPREQVLILLLDDLIKAPEATYERVLDFLGLPDHTPNYTPRNTSLEYKPNLLGAAGKKLRALFKNPALMKIKEKLFGSRNLHTEKLLRSLFMRKGKKQEISPQFRRHLTREFEADIKQLEQIISRDLSGWMK